jgi:hypothetical protein
MATVADKLRIKPGSTVWSSDPARVALLGALPDGTRAVERLADADTAIVFADDAASARVALDRVRDDLGRPSAFWVAYPKGNRADINRDSLWPILSEYGMRPISQVAIDDTWSALRFRTLEPGEAAFTGGR